MERQVETANRRRRNNNNPSGANNGRRQSTTDDEEARSVLGRPNADSNDLESDEDSPDQAFIARSCSGTLSGTAVTYSTFDRCGPQCEETQDNLLRRREQQYARQKQPPSLTGTVTDASSEPSTFVTTAATTSTNTNTSDSGLGGTDHRATSTESAEVDLYQRSGRGNNNTLTVNRLEGHQQSAMMVKITPPPSSVMLGSENIEATRNGGNVMTTFSPRHQ